MKVSPRTENFIRTALRKNNEHVIESVLKCNSDIRKTEAPKEQKEMEIQTDEIKIPEKSRINPMDLER